ncbi:MAG: trypsin-like peptidase domain-containing protein [Candidatus Paceibacterota bacterium]|nr:trypsin-like peptidase domain-containing protein [Candidatus Paceibacterota bacterium]
MKNKMQNPFFRGLILILLMFAFIVFLKPHDPVLSEDALYPNQSEVIKTDSLHKWVREHRANSVMTVTVKPYLDIKMYNGSDIVPTTEMRQPFYEDNKVRVGAGTVNERCQGCILTVRHVVDPDQAFAKEIAQLPERVASIQKENPGLIIQAKISPEYDLIDSKGKHYPATVIALDPKEDLALVRVKDWKHFSIPAIKVYRGKDFIDKEAAVIGAPKGHQNTIYFNAHTGNGRVIKTDHGDTYQLIIAPIVPGNSGGLALMLYNMEQIGVISAVKTSDGSYTNLGYMISNTAILDFLDRIFLDE